MAADVTAIAAYRAAKARLKSKIASLQGNSADAREYETFLNSLSSLNGVQITGEKDGEAIQQSVYSQIVEQIEKDMGVKLETEVLHLTEESANAQAQIKERVDQAQSNVFKKTETGSAAATQVDKLFTQMTVIVNKLGNKKDLASYEIEFLGYYKQIQAIVKNGAKKIRGGEGYTLPDSMKGTDLPLLLNRAKAMIDVTPIANAQGEIGELFVAYALSLYDNTSQKSVNEILDSFKKGQTNVTITGQDSTYNVYPNSLLETPNFKLATHRTQDKIDVQIMSKSGHPIGFSVKNYGNPAEVTLLSGNLGPLFNQYMDFMYHYYTLYRDPNVYQVAKNIAYFHALSGGILVSTNKNNLDNLIVSGSAEYLAVNDSHRSNSFRVYSIADISKTYLQPGRDGDEVFRIKGDDALTKPSGYGDQFIDQLNRSKSHISLLLKSVRI